MSDQATLFDEKKKSNGKPRERLYLCDAMALAYRAHFAFIQRPLVNKKGQDTSAIYGFTGSLIKLLEDEQPDHIAVVFDAPGKTFRDEVYEQYKAHRPPMPDGIREGIPYIKKIVDALDIPCVEVDGVEADDVIGTLAKKAEAEGVDVIIVSPDKDFRQLISEQISMLRPAYKGESFNLETIDTFREKYGVEPIQFIDVLALMGDSADNVPGVPGIGEKTALSLLQEHGSVERLLEVAPDLKAKRPREGLTEHADDARMSKELVTIMTDVPMSVDWHTLQKTPPNMPAVHAVFDELEFGKTLRERVMRYASGEGVSKEEIAPPEEEEDGGSMDLEEVDYLIALEKKDLKKAAKHIEGQPEFCFDTETTSKDQMIASLVGVAISGDEGKAAYLPTPMPDGTQTEAILDAIRGPLEDESILKIGHNLKYDITVLARHGLRVRGPLFDTMVAHYLVDAESGHRMDDLAQELLGYTPQPISELIGEGKDQISMRDVPIDKAGPYACEDADITLRLVPILRKRLADEDLKRIAEDIEFPLIHVLTDMEMTGVKLDTGMLATISKDFAGQLDRLEKEIYEEAGTEFNIGSPKQIGDIMFGPKEAGGMGLEPVEKTSTGAPSTNERVMSILAGEHALPRLILEWRKFAKLKSTYVDKLPELIHPETGRVHTDYSQTVAATGRLSSNNPNLQNIPIRSDEGREIRRAFVAEKGFKILSADYAQIELRIIAHMSGDKGLVDAFNEGLDIHSATASKVFDVPHDKVTRDMRANVKQVNYGIPYGISAFGLAQRMQIGRSEAQELIDQYYASYPDVPRFLNQLVEMAKERGYAETLMGRKRWLPALKSSNYNVRAGAERVAVNMPFQGTQADMIKLAMVNIHRRLAEEGLKSHMILQVHDELVFEVANDEVDAMKALVTEEMKSALPLSVPIEVGLGVADNWLDAH
ncbi:MAG: DNA polymerase I [Rubricoccaceae bacterium]|nr:DNA polymerase I [Rubricoccaceae bacterium]